MNESVHTKILRACQAFLVPIARMMLRAGVSYRELEELMRLAFVTVARNEYGLRGRPTNNSRIAAMTGIPRKEIARILSEIPVTDKKPRTELSPLGDVLQRWHTDPTYLDSNGVPLLLQAEGPAPSFAELVKDCSGDVPIGAIKVELLRTGAVIKESSGLLRAAKRVAVPESVDDRLITSLSFNLYCLASTIAYNSDPNRRAEGRIERFVQSDFLDEKTRAKLRRLTRRRIELFAEELDDVFSTLDSKSSEGGRRVGVGIYYYEDD